MELNKESTGKHFNVDEYLKARSLSLKALDRIQSNLFEGMTEQDGHQLIEKELQSLDSKKRWHPNKFRIGINTQKSFKETSEKEVTLKEGDVLFIDIGPVFGKHEADIGRTICFGNCSEELQALQKAAEVIFQKVKAKWETESLSGSKLYDYAESLSKKMGYEFNPKMAGHRLGDFPHALICRDSLKSFSQTPKDLLWVLEIHILCPKLQRGAFFEDILIKLK